MFANSQELREFSSSAFHDRWEAVESFKARELAALTEERACEIINNLGAAEPWRERADWSGLVEQQAIFAKGRQR